MGNIFSGAGRGHLARTLSRRFGRCPAARIRIRWQRNVTTSTNTQLKRAFLLENLQPHVGSVADNFDKLSSEKSSNEIVIISTLSQGKQQPVPIRKYLLCRRAAKSHGRLSGEQYRSRRTLQRIVRREIAHYLRWISRNFYPRKIVVIFPKKFCRPNF